MYRFRKLKPDHFCTFTDENAVFFHAGTLELAYARSERFRRLLDSGNRLEVAEEAARTLGVASEDSRCNFKGKRRNILLRLLLTSRCNLNCFYCQMNRGVGAQNWVGDSEIGRLTAILNKFGESEFDHMTVHFSGGEPLLALDQIKHVCEIGRECLPGRARFAMSTNGTLIDRKTADFIRDTEIKTVVSLDSLGSDGNFRLFRNGNKSVFSVLRGCQTLRDAGVDFGISLVVTSENISALIEITEQIIEELRPVSIGLNYAHYSGFDKESLGTFSERSLKRYAQMLFKCYQLCEKHNVFEEQSARVLEPFVIKFPRKGHCSSQSSQFSVAPNGSISACKTFLTKGLDTVPFDQWIGRSDYEGCEPIKKWRLRNTESVESCRECMVRNLCGGGCAYEAFVDRGDIMTHSGRYCVVPRYFIGAIVSTLARWGAFDDAGDQLRLLPDAERARFLRLSSLDRYGLTSSIGHMLE